MIEVGGSEKVAMAVTGHKTRSVFDRQHIVDSRDAQFALERTERGLTADPRNAAPAQIPLNSPAPACAAAQNAA